MSSSTTASEAKQIELLETIVTNLPLEKSSRSLTATRFLFGLLRTTNILNTSKACRAALEKKIGMQLKHATLDDLLISSYSYLNETLYDVDCVERILNHFLDGLQETNQTGEDGNNVVKSPALKLFGKLINALQASEALSIFAILNNLSRNLVAIEDLEPFSNGRLLTIVSNSSFCSASKGAVDKDVDGFRLRLTQFAKILGGN
nr:btb/poz domain-containing protein [Quercus suber]